MTIEELLEIEAIRSMRNRYSYYLDAGQLQDLVDLFTDNAVCEFGPYGVWRGKKTIAENYEAVERPILENGPFQSLHANTNHWVEIKGPDRAVGRVYLIDLMVNRPADQNPIIWLGLYDEEYRKVGGDWKISRSSLQFMWPQRNLSEGFVKPRDHGLPWPWG